MIQNNYIVLECPYCGYYQEPNPDDIEPNLHYYYNMNCDNCNKKYAYVLTYNDDYVTYKAPCWNGGEHTFRTVEVCSPYKGKSYIEKCRFCDYEK